MTAPLNGHIAFWRIVATDLGSGRTLIATLDRARTSADDAQLREAADALIRDIKGGSTMSEAMAMHESVFSRAVTTMVRAGEAGGVLDVITQRIVAGLEDGSFALPGAPAEEDPVRYWRAFGRLLSSGVPVLQAFGLLTREVCGPKLAEATEAIAQAISDGKTMGDGMQGHTDAFPNEVRLAVLEGERQGNLDEQAFRIADAIEADDLASLVPDRSIAESLTPDDEAAPVIKMVNLILGQAVKDKASDIHVEPFEDGLKLRYRVDGVLYEMEPPPAHLAGHIVNRLKIMADMDIAERRLPQDGRIHLNLSGHLVDLRVSTVPTVFGERVVLRILERDAVRLDLERIGFPPDELATVRELCHLPNGILISNGPAGSGKTTLLYAMLSEIDRDRHCVMSAEDPVEYHIPGVAQAQIEPKRGLTYARVLRSILRQDPDVIMVGELRDLETVQVAVQCSLTGHLLMTTMHANTSPGALRRLLDVGLEPFLVNNSVAGVISQRLVRVLCPECRREAEPPLQSIPSEAARFIEQRPDAVFYEPKGCDACHGLGYLGRAAIHEILVPDDRVRKAVAASADLVAIRNAALAAGMKPLLISGLEKAAAGVTSIQEVCRVAPHGASD